MKQKLSKYVLINTIFILICSQSFAETIHLIDGRVVNEKIIEKGPYYIVTEKDNIPYKYFTGQIDYIEEDEEDEEEVSDDVGNVSYPSFGDISEEKVQLISEFIDTSGVRRNMSLNIEQVIAQAPEENKENLRNLFVVDEIIERLIPVYHKYYTEEELKTIIQFYKSSAGLKFLDATPKIMQEAVGVSMEYLKEKTSQ